MHVFTLESLHFTFPQEFSARKKIFQPSTWNVHHFSKRLSVYLPAISREMYISGWGNLYVQNVAMQRWRRDRRTLRPVCAYFGKNGNKFVL